MDNAIHFNWRTAKFGRNLLLGFIAFFCPKHSHALCSSNDKNAKTTWSEISITSVISLHKGINDVTFFGTTQKFESDFSSDGRFIHVHPDAQSINVPLTEHGEIAAFDDYSKDGCLFEVFLPSAAESAAQSWTVIPFGSYESILPGWYAYSDNLSCRNKPLKTLNFYEGKRKGLPATFILTATQDLFLPRKKKQFRFEIDVWVFSTEPEGDASDPAPYFCLIDRYTTSSLYPSSSDALSTEIKRLSSDAQKAD
jgi:hypothetical protein